MSRLEDWLAKPRVTRWLGYMTLGTVVAMLLLAALTIPDLVSNTAASRRTDDLGSCRAEFATAVDDALVLFLKTDAAVSSATAAGVVAAIRQDPTTLALIAAEIEAAEERKTEALGLLEEAADLRSDAVKLSQSDPQAFLDECQRDN